MKIKTTGYQLKMSPPFIKVLEEIIESHGIETKSFNINCRDQSYSESHGGWMPVELWIENGVIRYVTDFSFVGPPGQRELAKNLDFDFGLGLFQQLGIDHPISEAAELWAVYQDNFVEYFRMGVYQIKVTPQS